jgi:AraC family cel operon transcriptional repressor
MPRRNRLANDSTLGRDKGKREERRRVGGSLRAKALEGLKVGRLERLANDERRSTIKLYWNDISPNRAFHFARASMQGRDACAVHVHDFAEVFWVERGSGTHLIHEQQVTISAGDLVTIRQADAHGFEADDKGFTLVNIAFPLDILRALKRRYALDDTLFWSKQKMPDAFHLTSERVVRMNHAAAELSNATNNKFAIERFLLNLVFELSVRSESRESSRALPEWISQMVDWAQSPEHFALGVNHIAKLANRSPEHVSREFRKHTGKTLVEALNEARMTFAAARLRISTDEIADIALACGFDSLGHFYQRFRAYHGVTPKQYRQCQTAAVNVKSDARAF